MAEPIDLGPMRSLRDLEHQVARAIAAVDAIRAERDAARQHEHTAQHEVALAVSILKRVEWTSRGSAIRWCPYCLEEQPDGHAVGCWLDAFITAPR